MRAGEAPASGILGAPSAGLTGVVGYPSLLVGRAIVPLRKESSSASCSEVEDPVLELRDSGFGSSLGERRTIGRPST